MAYSDEVIRHYKEPSNVGSMDSGSKSVGTGLVGAPECGDVMKLQIEVDHDTNEIIDAKFKTLVAEVQLRVLLWRLNGLRVKHWMKHIQFRIRTLLRNYHYRQSKYIAQFLQKMQLRQQLKIIKANK